MKDDKPTISKNREKKEAIVAELTTKVSKAKAIFFANYQGMTHHQIENLKKAIRSSDAEVVVTKNTLVKIALQKGNVQVDTGDSLTGGTLTLFAYNDIITPIKEVAKSFKAINFPEVKIGILEGKLLSAADVIKLSTLPPKEILLTQLVVGLKSPLYGFHRALNWNLQRLVLTLNAIQKTKSA